MTLAPQSFSSTLIVPHHSSLVEQQAFLEAPASLIFDLRCFFYLPYQSFPPHVLIRSNRPKDAVRFRHPPSGSRQSGNQQKSTSQTVSASFLNALSPLFYLLVSSPSPPHTPTTSLKSPPSTPCVCLCREGCEVHI